MAVQQKSKRKKMLKYAKKMLKYVITDVDIKIIYQMLQLRSRERFHHHMKVVFDGSKMARVNHDPRVKGIIINQGPTHAAVKTKKYGVWRIPYERLSPR